MLIILWQNTLELNEFIVTNCLEHVSTVSCIVEETATLTGWTLFLETSYVSHHHWANQIFWPNTFEIIVWIDSVKHPYLVEDPWCKIKKLIRSINKLFSFLSNKLVAILFSEIILCYIEIFLMISCSYRLAYSKYHVEYQIPVIMTEAYECLCIVFFHIFFILFFVVDIIF
jgi:hypothetical protein